MKERAAAALGAILPFSEGWGRDTLGISTGAFREEQGGGQAPAGQQASEDCFEG